MNRIRRAKSNVLASSACLCAAALLILLCTGREAAAGPMPEVQEASTTAGAPSGDSDVLDQLLRYEAMALEAVNRGEDPTSALEQMWSLSRTSASSGLVYIECAQRLLPLLADPDLEAQVRIQAAMAASYADDREQADFLFEDLRARFPDPASEWGRVARYEEAQSYLRRDEEERAVAVLEELWKDAAGREGVQNKRVGRQLVEAYYRAENWTGVLNVAPYVAAEPLTPDAGLLAIIDHVAHAHLELGEVTDAVFHYQRLVNFLRKLQAEDPQNPIFGYGPRFLEGFERRLSIAKSQLAGSLSAHEEPALDDGEYATALSAPLAPEAILAEPEATGAALPQPHAPESGPQSSKAMSWQLGLFALLIVSTIAVLLGFRACRRDEAPTSRSKTPPSP